MAGKTLAKPFLGVFLARQHHLIYVYLSIINTHFKYSTRASSQPSPAQITCDFACHSVANMWPFSKQQLPDEVSQRLKR